MLCLILVCYTCNRWPISMALCHRGPYNLVALAGRYHSDNEETSDELPLPIAPFKSQKFPKKQTKQNLCENLKKHFNKQRFQ